MAVELSWIDPFFVIALGRNPLLGRQFLVTRRARAIVSFFIIGHLLAVVLPPLAFQTRGPRGLSPSVATLLWPVERYSELLYLNRGYAFFAPDPGPSHLVRIASSDPKEVDAKPKPELEPVVFPNLQQQWPRLKYHRYFMVSEFLHDSYEPKLPPDAAAMVGPELPLEELQQWRLRRERYDAIANSIVRHWKQRNKWEDVTLTRLEHVLPDFVGFTDRGIPTSDPRGYLELTDETIDLQAVLNATALVEAVPVPDAEMEEEPTKPKLKTDAFLEPETVGQ